MIVTQIPAKIKMQLHCEMLLTQNIETCDKLKQAIIAMKKYSDDYSHEDYLKLLDIDNTLRNLLNHD